MQNTDNSKTEEMRVCAHAEFCGGCSYQGVSYEDQLKNKLGECRGYLRDNGIDDGILTEIEPCPMRFNYRNKMEYTFGDEVKDGPTVLGMHRKKSYFSIVPADGCMLVPEDFNAIRDAVFEFCAARGYAHYKKKTHSGLLRYLVLRKGMRTGEILINIVTTSEEGFDEEDYLSLCLGLKLEGTVVGVLHTVSDTFSDTVASDETRVLYGRDHYYEEILGLKFRVGAYSFFQTNVPAAERLYADALRLIPGIEGKTVFDLYCGTGTITQAMALKAAKVYGIEIVEEAVQSAVKNAGLNGLGNCEFFCGDVAELISKLPAKPDVIVVDPPRAGLTPKALEQIAGFGLPQILYISCNPKTLAMNLKSFAEKGYRPVKMKAYDNFPFTMHVETVVLLSKVNTPKA